MCTWIMCPLYWMWIIHLQEGSLYPPALTKQSESFQKTEATAGECGVERPRGEREREREREREIYSPGSHKGILSKTHCWAKVWYNWDLFWYINKSCEIYFGSTFILRCPCHTLHILTIIITIKYAKLHASNPKPNPNPNPNSRYIITLYKVHQRFFFCFFSSLRSPRLHLFDKKTTVKACFLFDYKLV